MSARPSLNGRSIESRVTKVESRLESMEETLGEIKRYIAGASNSRQFTLAHAGVIIAIILGIGGVGASYIGQVVTPIQSQVTVNVSDLQKADAALRAMQASVGTLQVQATRSEDDRQKINATLSDVDGRLDGLEASTKSEKAGMDAKLIEVESQFASSDQIRNLQHATVVRYIAMLWEKSFGGRFPSEVQYYPNISQHER